MSLKGMTKKEQQHVMEAVGLEFNPANAPPDPIPFKDSLPSLPLMTGVGGTGGAGQLPNLRDLPIPPLQVGNVTAVAGNAVSGLAGNARGVTNKLETNFKIVADGLGKAFGK